MHFQVDTLQQSMPNIALSTEEKPATEDERAAAESKARSRIKMWWWLETIESC